MNIDAAELWLDARDHEQAARWVESDADAARIRARVRALARAEGIRVRTARYDGKVVVVRLDAALWQQSTATMREKLTPPDGSSTATSSAQQASAVGAR